MDRHLRGSVENIMGMSLPTDRLIKNAIATGAIAHISAESDFERINWEVG
jgi:hypothetical protein